MDRRVFIPTLLIALPLGMHSQQANAWDGFDWDVWREETGAKKIEVDSPQAGLPDLLPLAASEGPDSPRIESIRGWEAKRDRILSTVQQFLGEPTPFDPVPTYADVISEERVDGHLRRHLRIASEPDDWIPAYLLIPDNLPSYPVPAMIVLHQTQAPGKQEPLGLSGDENMAFARELVERGYICLVPDAIGFGERTPEGAEPYHDAHAFYREHPNWTFFGKMVWDFQRMVDFLETVPEVDPYRIGAIGHSHGAYGALMGSIFEPRISAVIASCGFTTLRTDPSPERWSHLTALLPTLGFHVDQVESIPFDWHELAACLAPRPYFNWATLDDEIFPNTDNLATIYQELEGVYGLYGATEFLEGQLVEGKHSFPRERHHIAYDWLDGVLPPRLDPSHYRLRMPASAGAWEEYRSMIRGTLMRDLGPVDPPPGLGREFEVLEEAEREDYLERKIVYPVAPGETTEAYLFLPKDRASAIPGIVIYHQTVEEGKEEPAGYAGRESMHFGPELVRRGYAVLMPDSITAGTRITESGPFETREFYQDNPGLSAMGKMIQDGRRALDILTGLEEVDAGRIGVVGHSLGAETALFVAAFDDRVKVSGASCGFAPFATEANIERWARDYWFSYMPRLRIDLRAGRMPAWDFEDVIRLVAPRAYYNYQTREDEIFTEATAAHAMVESTRAIWRLYNQEANLRSQLDHGLHDISESGREELFGFFDDVLKGAP